MRARPWARPATWLPSAVLLVVLGAILRLEGLAAPPLDLHPTRQLRNAQAAGDLSGALRFGETVGENIPADADVIAPAQDSGFDLMYWGWRKVCLWSQNTALPQLRPGDRHLSACFAQLVAGNDCFLVTAFGQLGNQPVVAFALSAYSVAAEGEGYIMYDLNAPK